MPAPKEQKKENKEKKDTTNVVPKAHADELKPKKEKETWCFVGEDFDSRYCVKVPSEKSCTPDRIFHSSSDCEMIKGSHMPAGVTKHGNDFKPIQSMNFAK